MNGLAEQVASSAAITITGTSSSTDPASAATSVVSTEKAAQEGSISRAAQMLQLEKLLLLEQR